MVLHIGYWHRWMASAPASRKRALVLTMALLIAWGDFVIPAYIYMAGFYFLPIYLAVWYGGLGLTFAILAIAIFTSMHNLTRLLPVDAPLWHAALAYCSLLIVFASFASLMQFLHKLMERVELESQTDALTGLCNRRHFLNTAQFEIYRCQRAAQDYTFAMIDLDNFKQVNDAQGHAAGDALLLAVSRCMVAAVRSSDLVGRLGGDEFAVVLPETSQALAEEVLNRLHSNLRTLVQTFDCSVTASIGAITVAPGDVPAIGKVCEQADALMYAVKGRGKDGVFRTCKNSVCAGPGFS